MDGSDVEELLSVLSKATTGSRPSQTPPRGLTLDDVLSPQTRDEFLRMTQRDETLSSSSLPPPPSLSSSQSSSTSSQSSSSTGSSFLRSQKSDKEMMERLKANNRSTLGHERKSSANNSSSSFAANEVLLGAADESEIDSEMSSDPQVLCYEDKVVLRSHEGPCLAISQDNLHRKPRSNSGLTFSSSNVNILDMNSSTKKGSKDVRGRSGSIGSTYSTLSQVPASRSLCALANGNPTEHACEFLIVGTSFRSQAGALKHGDVIALLSKASGRYLGVYSSLDKGEEDNMEEDFEEDEGEEEDDEVLGNFDLSMGDSSESQWRVGAKRKIAGRREHWVVVEVPNETSERANEREKRLTASTARMSLRAKQLGYKVQNKALAPNKNDIPVTVRTSDTVLLRSVYADSLYLSSIRGKVCLRRLPNAAEVAKWSITKVPAPFLPLWARERPLLTGSSSVGNKENRADIEALQEQTKLMSREELEADLLEDLLFALQGIEGKYTLKESSGEWRINGDALQDKALVHLTERVLPLCSNFELTQRFVLRRSRAEFGRVSHALSSAMRELLRQYHVLVAQLEHQKQLFQLSIQKLWFYIQPSMRTLEVLANVARRTGNATGGALLNVLHRLASRGGDTKARVVYSYLIQRATIPYLEMLELWIYHGVIRDPYNEFMVCVDEEASKKTLRDDFNARYWDARYTLRRTDTVASTGVALKSSIGALEKSEEEFGNNKHVPYFLARIADKILTTGKYLNVVRECGRWVTNSCEQRIPYSEESHAYDQIISRAHGYASQTLLALLLEEEQLIARLRSIKHYFLLDQGDFFVHFMDIANEELQKPVQQITLSRLQSLLEMCLRVRNVNDPFQEDLACELVPYGLIQHVEAIHTFAEGRDNNSSNSRIGKESDALSISAMEELKKRRILTESHGLHGIDAFTLDFKVRWPLSLVLSRQALTKYQLIFRHLFFCKHVERQLCNTWLAHQTTKELNLRSALGPDFSLRQRMLHFLQNFEYYVMFEVLEPRWHEFEERLAKVKTVDDLMVYHSEFLDTCLRECLLTHQGLLKTLAKLMTTCLLFAQQIGRFADQVHVDETSMRAALREKQLDDDANAASQEGRERRGRPLRGQAAKEEEDSIRLHRQNQKLRNARIKVQEQHIRSIVMQQSYREMIRKNEQTFDAMLSTFMDELMREATHGEYHSHLTNLCTRLDFNNYYHKK